MVDYKAAELFAKEYDAKLLATDPRFNGAVHVIAEDGSVFFFLDAFVLRYEWFYLVFTEHHGYHVYSAEEDTQMKAYGQRIAIEKVAN